ncbi:MAG: histidinol-phosphate transaminase [Ahniella sp.]|nr:histidinol-phosphate transaminase [Ahniella sp.]
MSVLDLARPELLALAGYSSARLEASQGRIFLNANEAPESPVVGADCHRYPDPQPESLRQALATLYGVDADQCLVGRGSDEAIDLLTRVFCRAGQDAIVISPPTFGMYAVCARVQNAEVVEIPLDTTNGFAYPLEAVMARIMDPSASPVRLVYVCTPNNPTGNEVPFEWIERLCLVSVGRCLVVVDEAYGEFSGTASATSLLSRHEHVVVLRTLSKAHGLAGERIGVCLAAPTVIGLLRKIMAPYPLPASAVALALQVLAPAALAATSARIAAANAERSRLAGLLRECPLVREVLPSAANFLAVRFTDPNRVYQHLLSRGIVLRQLQKYPGLADALRISIGTPAEHDELFTALKALAGTRQEAA